MERFQTEIPGTPRRLQQTPYAASGSQTTQNVFTLCTYIKARVCAPAHIICYLSISSI